ncbi:MAG: repair protein SbcC/Rad50 [Actinomycetota bacterium]|nr:repair protein SbcC/Rad50 [Actinomycetota bacterium]
MRLHRLTVTAFGPYRDTQTVDFEALGADGLFLLHGETGAGKTTVLDAVAFALFGVVPGARNQARRLRSDHADPSAHPEVQLELTVQGRRIRLVRSPEYSRPKRRGEGFTTQPATASLTWLDEPGSEGLIRIDEVARTVERLLGMTADQFFQVVLLPQGEFARFLRAETDERQKLLERLFDTRRFADVERWFADRRTASGRELGDRSTKLGQLVARTAQAAGVDQPAEGDADRAWAEAVVADLRTARDAAGEDVAAAARAAETAAAEFTAAEKRRALVTRRARADAALAAVVAERPENEARRESCEAARRAAPVRAAVQVAESTRAAATRRAAELAAAWSALRALAGPLDEPGLRTALDGWRGDCGRLTELLGEVDRLASDERTLAGVRASLGTLATELDAIRVERDDLPGRVAAAEEALAEAVAAAAAIEGIAARHEAALTAHQAALALADASAEAERLVAAATTARAEHLAAKETWLAVREARLAGMAAELAAGLVDGEPCAVCGAQEHPAPARPAASAVDAAAEKAAHAEAQLAEAGYAEAAEAVVVAEREVARLRALSGDRTLAELADVVAELSDRLAAAGALVADRTRRAAAVDAVRAEAVALEERSRVAGTRGAELEERARALTEAVAARRQRLDEARGEDTDVVARRERIERMVATADAVLTAAAAERHTAADAAEREGEAETAAWQAGFASAAEALAAALEPAALTALSEALRRADDAEAAARAAVTDPELADTDGAEEVDTATPAAAVEATRAALRLAEGAFTDRKRRVEETAQLVVELEAGWDGLEPVRRTHEELTALTDVVNGLGQNTRRMSLRAYVLAARLEEVAVAATRRLLRMSGGRYSFVHTDAAGPRNTRGGLGLDVADDYSGSVRAAKTLSGGESFLASLALALGLADVVAAESGGAMLDTLFIDEGFGSLDAATLDLVMDTLDELRAGGRVVGVVSHVDELRQRIPSRLHVRKGRSGSSIEVRAIGPAAEDRAAALDPTYEQSA